MAHCWGGPSVEGENEKTGESDLAGSASWNVWVLLLERCQKGRTQSTGLVIVFGLGACLTRILDRLAAAAIAAARRAVGLGIVALIARRRRAGDTVA